MIANIAIQEKEQVQSYWDADQVYTFDEYFEIVQKVPFKCEFRNGKIIAMPNATNEHGNIIDSLLFYLKLAIKQQKLEARASSSEVRVFIEAINEGLYPDCHVTVGEIHNYKKNKGITNPSILIEVLSESTYRYDKGEKFRKYQLLPSFQEYVLIEQDTPVIDVLVKKENGKWEMSSFIGLDDVLELTTLDIKIPLSDIYEDVENLSIPQFKIDLA